MSEEKTTDTTEATSEEEATTPVAVESIEDLEPKMKLEGTVKRLELYGAFVDLGIETDALIHISQLSEDRVNRVSDILDVGDEIEVWVDKVDPKRSQIMVTMVEPVEVEWGDLKRGQAYTGKVMRLESFGAFIDIGAEREGLVHISELSHDYVNHPSEVVSVGDEVEVQVLNYSKRKRRIDLSMKALTDKPQEEHKASQQDLQEYEEEDYGELPTAMEIALRRAMGEELDERGIAPKRNDKSERGGKRKRKKSGAQEEIFNRTLQYERD